MSYKILRKDLLHAQQKCNFCPKYLTSLKAYVLEDQATKKIVYAGPDCAKKNIGAGQNLADIPDLTKFTNAAPGAVGAGGPGNLGGMGGNAGAADNDRKRALEYLSLREDKLALILGCSYAPLANYYNLSKSQNLTDSEISHILNIEAKALKNLDLTSLQKCYNYLFWIDVAIGKLKPNAVSFLTGIRAALITKGSITDGQKNAANNWLKNLAGVPQLK